MPRRGSPSPPRRLSDAALEKARPHEIEKHMAEHEAFVDRLERIPDPGKGMPSAEAERARAQHLARIEKQADEVVRLAAALPREPDPTRQPGVLRKLRRIERRMIAKAHEGESQQHLDGLHETMREREKERDAKREIAKISERRKHPPDPKSASVLAALVVSDFLKEALERKFRDNIVVIRGGEEHRFAKGDFTNARLLNVEDMSVLLLASYAIEDGPGLLAARDPDRGLLTLDGVGTSLANLRRAGILSVAKEGERRWRVSWGERARKIAREAGVADIPPAVVEAPEAVVTRS